MARATSLFAVVFLLVALCGCASRPESYASRAQAFPDGVMLYSVYDAGGQMVYGFFANPAALPLTSTNDSSVKPIPDGILWVHNTRSGLWVNGVKVCPEESTSKVIAVRADGSMVPVDLNAGDYQLLAKTFGTVADDELWSNRIAPALRLNPPR